MSQTASHLKIIAVMSLFWAIPFNAQAHTRYTSEEIKTHDIGREIMGDIHELVVNGKTSGKDTVLLDLNACLEHGQDTIGMNTCLAQAYKAYDKILNQVYQLALSRSDEETQKALKLSEQKWVAFRNAERGAQGAYGQSERGTILGIAIGYQNITAIRERIAELMFYLGADQG